ncbi:MAG: hypothetical protein A2V67_18355 [Deltaproteobacteria bacterium RBG_13_61_14]|nr:MAG: hypothetical protein A2V67_18355 [Deltaproteobacteria bacterium RBG_13_61_14]
MKTRGQRIGWFLMLAGMLVALRWGSKAETIYQGPDNFNYVQLVEVKKDRGPFEHPAVIPAQELERVLLELEYVKPGLLPFSKGGSKERELFPQADAAQLAPFLSQALKKADPSQWVEFSWKATRRLAQASFLVKYLVHDGVLFVKDGRLQIAFRNIGYEEILETDMLSRLDPLRSYSGMYDLVLPPLGQWPAPNLDAQGEPARRNWIAIPLDTLAQIPEPVAAPAGGEAQEPAVLPPSPPPAQRSAEARLQELKKLLDQDLITQEDYDRKKQEILDEF